MTGHARTHPTGGPRPPATKGDRHPPVMNVRDKAARRALTSTIGHAGLVLVGVLLLTAGYNLFFIQNSIAPGGFTGLATILHAKLGWPVGLVVLIMNLPLFVLSYKEMGLRFFLMSVLATVGLSMLIDLLPKIRLTDDLLLASVYGGFLLGVGLALVLRGGATTGGSDMTARLLNKRVPALRIAWILLAVDSVVVVLAGLAFGLQMSLYALIALFISSRIVDLFQEGATSAKAFFIITTSPQAIADEIFAKLNRGATALKGEGMYSGKGLHVLLCVVYRTQVTQLKAIVHELDPGAFVIVTDVREALGKGFAGPPAHHAK